MNESVNTKFNFEPRSLIRDILHNIWVVILAALIGFMAVTIWNYGMYTPQYTSTATLLVNLNNSASYSYTSLSSSSEIAEIYTKVFTQNTMAGYAAENLGQSKFSGHISSSVLAGTNIFTVSVTSSSPETSYEELCSVLEVYPKISEAIFSDSVIDIMRYPNLPAGPSNSITSEYRSLAVGGCAILALAIIIVISLMRDTVKDEKTFENEIDAKLIGTVTHEKRRKKAKGTKSGKRPSMLVDSAFASYAFSENYHKIATKLEYLRRSEGAKVFLITSYAASEGKSTTASNIALTLARRGSRVALIDMDFFKPSVNRIFEVEADENRDIALYLSGKLPLDGNEFYRYKETRLDLGLNKVPHRDYVDWINSEAMAETMKGIRASGKYDFIIVDTPPVTVAADVTSLLKIVDRAILVVRTDVVRIADINDAILGLKESGKGFLGCILNDVPKEFSFGGQLGLDESGYYGGYKSYYGKYGKYSKYGKYGSYGKYGAYGAYGSYEAPKPAEDTPAPQEE